MPRHCPSCQAPVSPRSRFCPSCGENLPAAEVETSSTPVAAATAGAPEGAAVANTVDLPTVPAGSAAPVPVSAPAPQVPPPPAPPSAGPEYSRPAPPASGAVAPTPRSRPPFGPEACPVELAINFPHVLVAGHSTTIELRVTLNDATPVEQLQVNLDASCLSGQATSAWRRLAPAQTSTRLLEVEATRSGNFLLQLSAVWVSGGQQFAYRGQRPVKVLQAPESGNIQISISDLQSNAGTGANQGLGADYGDISISNLLGGLKTLNDLLEVELPTKFHVIDLELDYEVSRKELDATARRSGEALRIPPSLVATVAPATLCTLEPADGNAPLPFRLVARPTFRFGRARAEADFIAWVLPRSPENDERSKRVSMVHVVAEIAGGNLIMRDNGSSNGSTLDGQPLDATGAPAAQRSRLVFGGQVEVDVACFDSARAGDPPVANLRSWNGPAGTIPAARGAVRCEVLAATPQPLNAVWLLTDAAFGTSRSNPIQLAGASLAEIQGRFHHFRGCFWIENLADNSGVQLDRLTLRPGEFAPLATGQLLRLGDRLWRIKLEA